MWILQYKVVVSSNLSFPTYMYVPVHPSFSTVPPCTPRGAHSSWGRQWTPQLGNTRLTNLLPIGDSHARNTSATIRPWRYKALVTPTLQSVFMQQRWCERFNFLRCTKINGSLGARWMDWQFLWCSLVIRTIESARYQTGITFHEAKERCIHKWNPCCLFRVYTDKKMCSRTALLRHPVHWSFVRSAANRSHNILTLRKWG